jgi:hypothetical protein
VENDPDFSALIQEPRHYMAAKKRKKPMAGEALKAPIGARNIIHGRTDYFCASLRQFPDLSSSG